MFSIMCEDDGGISKMFCDNCGKEILEEDRFCPFCGTKVSEENTGAAGAVQMNAPVKEASPYINASADLVYNYGNKPIANQNDVSINTKEVCTRAFSLSDALHIAAERGTSWRHTYEGEEDYEPEQFDEDTSRNKILRLAKKYEKAKPSDDTIYIVSKEGAVGEIIIDDEPDPERDIYWDLYTKERVFKYLPRWQKDIIIQ
jgi:hypothetical protein